MVGVYLLLGFFALLTVVLAVFANRLEWWGVPTLLIAAAAGILVGPATGLLDPATLHLDDPAVLEQVARVTLTVSLLGVSLRFPRAYWRGGRRWLVTMLTLGMLVMCAIATGVVGATGIPILVALAIGAAITPTDPVVTTPVVTGDAAEARIPTTVRRDLSSESGLNDGLAYLLVMAPVLLLTKPDGEAVTDLFAQVLAWEVLVPVVLGGALGFAGGRVLAYATARGLTSETFHLGFALAFAALLFAGLRMLETDALLGVFVAGAVLASQVPDALRGDLQTQVDALSKVFVIPVFAVVGMLFTLELPGAPLLLAPAIVIALLLRRLVGVWAVRPFLRSRHSRAETLFMSWFGPVGVSALFYATLITERTGEPLVLPAVVLAIVASVLVHGLSTGPAGRRLQRATAGSSTETAS